MDIMDPFAPLVGKQHCNVFLLFMILTFAGAAISLLLGVLGLWKSKSKILSAVLLAISLIFPFLIYYMHRVTYSMCKASTM